MDGETEVILNFIYDKNLEGLKSYIVKNQLRITERLGQGESILTLAMDDFPIFEELVIWY